MDRLDKFKRMMHKDLCIGGFKCPHCGKDKKRNLRRRARRRLKVFDKKQIYESD